MTIQIKCAYDKAADNDGTRILVDRIWPRGVSKEELKIDYWMKNVLPLDSLRKWFDHDEDKFSEFKKEI